MAYSFRESSVNCFICGLASALSVVAVAASASAGVGDPTLRTDHPQYAGEGAFQTVEDCVAFATAGQETSQAKALAVFNWILTHQFHLHSPQEWLVPGVVPGSKQDDYEMVVYDANKARFSYGYGLCGTVHAWNEPYWRALGMNARRRAFPGHVNSEIEYDGDWHAFDTDMAGLVFRPDGIIAGYADIMADPSLVRLNDRGIVCYPFAWPGDFDGMKKGWQEVARGGNWYCMYNSGYAALPGIVHVRRGETFTRHFDRDVFGGPAKRRFWHVQKDGPFRNWTFVNMGEPQHHGEKSNCRGNASYANAVCQYEPNLADATAWHDGAVARSVNLVWQAQEPHLTSADERTASVTFEHFSPYVICGDPVDDTNPMTGHATDGLVLSAGTVGQVTLELSVDRGSTWETIGPLGNDVRLDLTEHVKGRYGWWLRFSFSKGSGLKRLRTETTCQMNQAIYPRLTPNGSAVAYRAKSRAVACVKPNWSLPEPQATRYEVRELRSASVSYTPRSRQQMTAYSVAGNKPAQIVFRVDAPEPLLEISAAARYRVRSPQPEGCDFHLESSQDEGRTWQTLAQAHNAADNEYSSGWMYGTAPVRSPGVRSVLVKVHLYGGGYGTGLVDFEAYGVYRTAEPDAAEVTWAWRTPGAERETTHVQRIAAGLSELTWTVPTPEELSDSWVRIRVP